MLVQQRIQDKLSVQFKPQHLEVINESNMHNVPAGSESHFKVVIACDSFEGLSLIKRHRAINQCLAEEFSKGLHALSIHAYTLVQWQKLGSAPVSPACGGGA